MPTGNAFKIDQKWDLKLQVYLWNNNYFKRWRIDLNFMCTGDKTRLIFPIRSQDVGDFLFCSKILDDLQPHRICCYLVFKTNKSPQRRQIKPTATKTQHVILMIQLRRDQKNKHKNADIDQWLVSFWRVHSSELGCKPQKYTFPWNLPLYSTLSVYSHPASV